MNHEEEMKLLRAATEKLEQMSGLYDALDKVMTWMIQGKLVMPSIGGNDLKEYALLLNEIKAALVRAQGGDRELRKNL